MSIMPNTVEAQGQLPDPADLLQNLNGLSTDQKKYNHLRDLFLEEADVDEYINYLDTDEDIDLTRRQLTQLKATLEGYKVYLKEYLEQTGERIGRFDERLKQATEEMADPDLTREDVRRVAHTRERVAQAMQIAKAPRGAKGKSLKEVSQKDVIAETALTIEQAELLKNLEAQYPAMKASLERRKISTDGMPTWERIKKGLTPEVLDKALKHKEPALLLIPPTTRQSKVEAIDNNPATCQKFPTGTCALNDNNLWNGGKTQAENQWRVSIVEGVEDVAQDNNIYDGERTNYEMTKLWVEKYEKEGMDVINDADSYLVLMMKRMDEGKPVDPNTYTVLNGKNLTKTSLVAHGYWYDDQVLLYNFNPDSVYDCLRLRGSVGVDVTESA